MTPQSENLISFNCVSRGCVNVSILIYFTLNYSLENSHPTPGQKIQIFITFYLVSKSLVLKFSEKQKPTIFQKLIDWKKMKHYESKAMNIFYAVNLFIVATSPLTADLLALAFKRLPFVPALASGQSSEMFGWPR